MRFAATTTVTLLLVALAGAQKVPKPAPDADAPAKGEDGPTTPAGADTPANATIATDAPAASGTGISKCILSCVGAAAVAEGCGSFKNTTCVCSSAQFQADVTACLMDNCSKTDVGAAVKLQADTCGAASVTPTGSATTTNKLTVPTDAPSKTGVMNNGSSSSTASSANGTATSPAGTTPPKSGAAVVRGGAVALVGVFAAVALAL